MVSDEDWRKAPDWDKIKELKHPCDCPSSCERKVVGCGYDGSRAYWCRNCGCVYCDLSISHGNLEVIKST